jgi:DNA-binding Xre family transcriptional regulator
MKITIKNRLAILIRQRQINSASEFGRRMTAAGFPMSSSHASRYEKETSPGFDLKFMNVACNVLQCTPNDLYEMVIELEPGETVDPTLTFPRHAFVLNKQSDQGNVSATNVPAPKQSEPTAYKAPEPAALPKQPTVAKSAPRASSRPATSNDDTGPAGVIFPFSK